MKNLTHLFAAVAASAAIVLAAGCNTDNVIYDDRGPLPVIEFDTPDGVYSVKAGRALTLTPRVDDASAACEWLLDDEPVGRERSHTFMFGQAGSHYVTFRARNAAGMSEEELRIDVLELQPPVISLALASGSKPLLLTAGASLTLRPTFQNSDGPDFACEWLLEGRTVSRERTYTFCQSDPGRYVLTLRAENEDGSAVREIEFDVVDALPQSVRFAPQSHLQQSTDRSTVAGRPVYLRPIVENFAEPRFAWSVDGAETSDGPAFVFTPAKEGDYIVAVTVTDVDGRAVRAEVRVHCAAAAAAREKSPASLRTQSRVYEYIPAPGQFINDTQTGGFTDRITTHDAAAAYAAERLEQRRFVSLGGFGGYIVVGFDHSVVNRGGAEYDFSIQGNAFLSAAGGSNEPGIVWVMQDANGNGLPDDEWYELRGSESGAEGTIQDYAVTYYRPAGPKMAVQWSDSEGATGQIDYVKAFHRQDFYYPLWIESDTYTLRGTRLAPRNSEDATGNWHNNAYGWGYADNYGEDNLSDGDEGGDGQSAGFRIANAMLPDGTPVRLDFIDFVKVQTALNTKSGALGENSTEVYSFTDLAM